jgi:type II secretory pathway pseudopilin PulG
MSAACGRRGFTALELIIVLGVMFLLVSLGLVGVVPALRKSRIQQSVTAVVELCTDAIVWSRSQEDRDGTDVYGICFDGTGDPHVVALVFGDPATPATMRVVKTHALNRNVMLFWGATPLTTKRYCFFQPTSGFPMNLATRLPQAYGTGVPGAANTLSARSLDGEYRLALGIYSVGIVHDESF